MDTLIKSGRVITASDDFVADILVQGEHISLIGDRIEKEADKVIDAEGKYVLPGLVDPHTHLDLPFAGTRTCDDFETGHIAAAFGGTTCHIDFPIQEVGGALTAAVADWDSRAREKAIIDYGFHIVVTDLDGREEELASLPAQGITSFKLFMAYKGAIMLNDAALFRAMQIAAESGAMTVVHAENGDVIDQLVKQALAAGHVAPRYHSVTRPPITEGEATGRAVQLAHLAGAPIYIVHVSCRESLEVVAEARARGWDVRGETCPQYLMLDESALEAPGFEGAKYVFTPPPRTKADQARLWEALRTDQLSVVSTDHTPFTMEHDKILGRENFALIPNGAPGIENRLHIMHEFGVRKGRIGLNRMVQLLAASPAREFGLYPKKGTIAVGSDADVVVFDPEQQLTITAETQHSRSDYNVFEGTEVTGTPVLVMRRGEVLVENGRFLGRRGTGRFVKRKRTAER